MMGATLSNLRRHPSSAWDLRCRCRPPRDVADLEAVGKDSDRAQYGIESHRHPCIGVVGDDEIEIRVPVKVYEIQARGQRARRHYLAELERAVSITKSKWSSESKSATATERG